MKKKYDFFMRRPSLIIFLILFFRSLFFYAQEINLQSIKNDSTTIIQLLKSYEQYEYSNPDTAILICKHALELAKQQRNKKYEAYSLYYLGGLYDTKGLFETAYSHYFDALKLFEQQKNKQGLGGCLNCIGIVLWEQSEQASPRAKNIKLEKALRYIAKGLRYYNDIHYKMGMAVCYMNNGIVYNDYAKLSPSKKTENRRYQMAIENYKKAILLFKEINDTRSLSDCNLNIALLYYDLYFGDSILSTKEYQDIEQYLNDAETQYQQHHDLYGKAMVLKNKATIEIDYSVTQTTPTPYLHKAVANAKASLAFADSVDGLFLKYDAYQALYKAYKRLCKYDSALYFFELYSATKDSVHRIKQLETIEEMEARYNAKENEIEIKQQKIKYARQKTILIGTLIFLLLILTLASILIHINNLRKKTNKTLHTINDELHLLNTTQNRLMSIISHDLKAPLSAFYSITSSLKSKLNMLEKDEIEEYLTRMLNSSLSVKLQLENLLNWAIAQSTEIRINNHSFNLSVLVQRTILVLEEFANEKKITILSSVEESIEIYTDSRLLNIVLNNLLANAIKFSNPRDEIEIRAIQNADNVVISVKDNGIGISDDRLATLFSQNDNTINVENRGTGLGLTVSKDIIEKLGGKIWVESKLDIGSTFFVELPANNEKK